MKQYLEQLQDILDNGMDKPNRTGVPARTVFGRLLRFNLQEGFPLVTTRKINFKAVVAENLWFIKGQTNVKYLHADNIHIWDEWADLYGSIGPMYGRQFRNFNDEKDQIVELLRNLRDNPNSRRHVITSWNPLVLPNESLSPQQNVRAGKMALAPCHGLVVQFDVTEGKLSCSMTQRSADFFIGSCYNIAGYAFLTHLIAHHLGYEVGDLVYITNDTHLYHNLFDQAREQLSRKPRRLPSLVIKTKRSLIESYEATDFELVGYDPHPAISTKGLVAV